MISDERFFSPVQITSAHPHEVNTHPIFPVKRMLDVRDCFGEYRFHQNEFFV
jgi:hypothetical protein